MDATNPPSPGGMLGSPSEPIQTAFLFQFELADLLVVPGYRGLIRPWCSAPDRCQRPRASLGQVFLFYPDLAGVDFAPSSQPNRRLFPFFHPQGPLGFE